MPSQEDIENQQRLLSANRQTLAFLLYQKVLAGGIAFVSVGVLNSIKEARSDIRRIKAILLSWGADVEDHPDDEEQADIPLLVKVRQSDKQLIQIVFSGNFPDVSLEQRDAAIRAFAEKLGISSDSISAQISEQIEVYRVFEGSIGFDLGISKDIIPYLRSLLESDDSELHALEVERVTIFGDEGFNEIWIVVDGHFVRTAEAITPSYQQYTRPPVLAEHLISLLWPRENREFLLGDLAEEFHIIYKESGNHKAVSWYYYQVIASLFPLLYWYIWRFSSRKLHIRLPKLGGNRISPYLPAYDA